MKQQSQMPTEQKKSTFSPALVALLIVQAIAIVVLIKTTEYEHPIDIFYSDFVNLCMIFVLTVLFVLVGFGFLFAFRPFGAFNSVASSTVIMMISIIGTLIYHVIKDSESPMISTIQEFVLPTIAVIVSCGSVLGHFTMPQVMTLAMIELVFYFANRHFAIEEFMAIDTIGAVSTFIFGSLFGLCVAVSLRNANFHREKQESRVEVTRLATPNRSSIMFSFFGATALVVLSPIVFASFAPTEFKTQAMLNIVLALIGSIGCTVPLSIILDKDSMLPGAVIARSVITGMLTYCVLPTTMNSLHAPLVMGALTAAISLFTTRYVIPALHFNGVRDASGVFAIFFVPALVSWFFAILVMWTKTDILGVIVDDVADQVFRQVVSMVITVFVAVVGGLITGVILSMFDKRIPVYNAHSDHVQFAMPPTYAAPYIEQ
eukprot:gnl/Dysnectes_brevis/917_a1018_5783.p1 GENE.gnl/Dysnectes_brevis/917_a1018_5783~~gnl/Dysnectes_brevis/917_a1018_5783.p1  ORF type:complete len:431 (-),score=159.46 gnl/Dysnectes_brevis/917_a1018_5783:45-1337(-)